MAHVLVVDDDESVRKTVSYVILFTGNTPVAADNGKAGLDLLVAHNPSLILLDCNMPVMGGMEFLSKMALDPKYECYKTIPVVAIGDFPNSANPLFEARIAKPFEVADLQAAIVKYCEQ